MENKHLVKIMIKLFMIGGLLAMLFSAGLVVNQALARDTQPPVSPSPAQPSPFAPVISIDPAEIVSEQTAQLVTIPLTITNSGDETLDWTISDVLTTNTWEDNFDSYATNSSMHGQGGWKGWGNDPAATAFTRDTFALSTPNSVEIVNVSDLVHEYAGYTSGVWEYSAWQYIPVSFTGESYFILLNRYDDPGTDNNWSVQVDFNGTANQVQNTGFTGGTLPLIRGQWVELRVEIDLDNDLTTFFYNDAVLYQGTWTEEVSGGGSINIAAVDLWGNLSSSVYYDNISLDQLFDTDWLSTNPDEGSTAAGASSNVDVLLDATGLANGVYTATLWAASNDPVDPLLTIPVTMTVVEPSPDIVVTPISLEATLLPDTTKVVTMTIANNGEGPLDWSLSEAAGMEQNGSSTGVPERLSPIGVPAPAAPNSTPLVDVIADGSFEDGTPNSFWNEYSLNFGTPLCDIPVCGTGTGTGPRTGDWWSWFGGIAVYEEGYVSQDVTLTSGTAELSFWLEAIICDSSSDYMEVLVDGTQVYLVTGDSPLCGVFGYSQQTVDLSSYADGGVHEIQFHSETFAVNGDVSNFFVDDVVLNNEPGVDIPWLSEDPTSGTVPAGGSVEVAVTFDASGLSADTYLANLNIDSNDPDTPVVSVPVTMTVESVDLAIDKSGPVDPVKVGELITYTLEVSNLSTQAATGVTVVDTLPDGVTYIPTAGCTEDAGVVTCVVGDLAGGGSSTITIVVVPNEVGDIVNQASVSGNELDPILTNNADEVTTTVELGLFHLYLPIVFK